jgi:hypothetical protein
LGFVESGGGEAHLVVQLFCELSLLFELVADVVTLRPHSLGNLGDLLNVLVLLLYQLGLGLELEVLLVHPLYYSYKLELFECYMLPINADYNHPQLS